MFLGIIFSFTRCIIFVKFIETRKNIFILKTSFYMAKIIDCFPFYPSLYFVNVTETSSVYFMATLSDQFGPKQMDISYEFTSL